MSYVKGEKQKTKYSFVVEIFEEDPVKTLQTGFVPLKSIECLGEDVFWFDPPHPTPPLNLREQLNKPQKDQKFPKE